MLNQNSKTGLRWLWLTVVVLAADLASKFILLAYFRLYDSIEILPFFHITYVRNYGAAFSTFLGQRWVLATIAIVVSLLLIGMLRRNSVSERLNNISLALILGGALGNLFDRLYHGFVVDFLDVYIFQWRYPTFNLADSAICIGVVLMLWDSFIKQRNK